MEHYREEYIRKKEAEREQRKVEFEDQLTKVFKMLVENINPMRKPRWTNAEIIPFINYHLRNPFFGLLDSYRMVRGEFNIELVNARTYRLQVHYYQHSVMPTEIFISAKRPTRTETAKRMVHTLHDALRNKLMSDNPMIFIPKAPGF